MMLFPVPPAFRLASQVSRQMARDLWTPWQHCHFVNTQIISLRWSIQTANIFMMVEGSVVMYCHDKSMIYHLK